MNNVEIAMEKEIEKDQTSTSPMRVYLDNTKRYYVIQEGSKENNKVENALRSLGVDASKKLFASMCDWEGCRISDDEHVYCYGCDAQSHGICKYHPLIFVTERPIRMRAAAKETMPSFCTLRQSTIPRAGNGIFTTIFLPAGSTFGPYGGIIIYEGEEAEYTWEMTVGKQEINVDASDPMQSNYLRWINCARYKEEQNMLAVQYHKRMYYIVFRPVMPGEELLVWYGSGYAERLGIENLKRATENYAPFRAERDPKAITAGWPLLDEKFIRS